MIFGYRATKSSKQRPKKDAELKSGSGISSVLIPSFFTTYGELLHECYKEALNLIDIGYHTPLQIIRTFSNVFTNYAASTDDLNICNDADNPHSWFNQTVHDGQQYAGHTALEWGLGYGLVFPAMLGAVRRHYIIKHQAEVKSKEYLLERIKEARQKYYGKDKTYTIPEDELNKLINSVYEKLVTTYHKRFPLDSDFAFVSDKEIEYIVDGELKDNDYYVHLLNEGRKSTFATSVKAIYDKVGDAAGVFWPTWFATVVVTGFTATLAPPYLTAIALYSVSASTLINLSVAILRNVKKRETQYPDELTKRLDSQKNLFTLLKKDHEYFKRAITPLIDNLALEKDNSNYKSKFPKLYEADKALRHKKMVEIIGLEIGADVEIPKKYEEHTHYNEKKLQEKFIASTITNMVGHATAIFFLLWLVSSTFGGLAFFPSIATPMQSWANFFSDQALTYKLAGFTMIIAGLSSYVDHVINKAWYRHKAGYTGDAAYKPEKKETIKLENGTVETLRPLDKKGAFNVFYFRVEQLKRKLDDAKLRILENRELRSNLGIPPTQAQLDAENFILKYEVIDVLNDYYRENMKQAPDFFSRTKKTISRTLASGGTAQTWIFNARNFGLYGGPFAKTLATFGATMLGPTVGPLVAFCSLVVVFGSIGGVVGYTNYVNARDDHHRLEFLNNFDACLSLVNKQYTQLDYVCKLADMLNPSASGSNTPARTNNSPSPAPTGYHQTLGLFGFNQSDSPRGSNTASPQPHVESSARP